MTQAVTATAPIPPPTQAPASIGEHRFAIRDVTWGQYEAILAALGDHPQRIAYCEGTIELRSPGPWHESYGYLLGRMVDILTEELDIPMKALGSTTLRRRDAGRGLEADRTYYLANAGHLTGADHLDLGAIPPPDLAIEVEITSSILDKLSVYAGLGVPELWRHDGQSLRVFLLGPDGAYAESPTSRAFPFLPMPALDRQLREVDPTNDTRWARAFRTWVREVVAPLYLP